MSTIIEFNQKEKKQFIKSIEKSKYWLDVGCEGNCYLINKDVYKVYKNTCTPIICNTICKDDLDLKSILFPNEIYTCDQVVFAYKTDRYIQGNNLLNIECPNLDSIKKALKPLIKDIYVLSKNHIFADDLSSPNLLFDGKRFYIIDTLRYEHHNELDVEQIYKENINLLIYECFFPFIHENDHYYELIPYIKKLAKKVQEEYKDKETQKIKRP